MQQKELNTDGFRLKYLEIYNWGTFNHKIWRLEAEGQNTLLTGDIGSGKSTLVDAATTLLVPSQKNVFNKAAGAAPKERDLRSYVMGYFRTESGSYGNSKPVELRPDYKDYTVILEVFSNEELKKAGYEDHEITLALVLWMSKAKNQPERMFVTAEKALNIKEHFSDFGKDIPALKRHVRKFGAETFDSFPMYSAWFKRHFGLADNDQAIELFAHAVSMKTVESISSFVQNNMLQEVATDNRIEEIIDRFNDLDSTYNSVCKARDMKNKLEPMKDLYSDLSVYKANKERFEQAKKDLDPFIGFKRRDLLISKINSSNSNLKKNRALHESLKNKKTALSEELDRAKDDRRRNGGDRIEELGKLIKAQQVQINVRKQRYRDYESLIKPLEMNPPRSVLGFAEQKQKIEKKSIETEAELNTVQQEMISIGSQKASLEEQIKNMSEEYDYIQAHPSNIAVSQLRIRERICEAIGVNTDELPFAGELIEIKESEKNKWEGSIERVLHGFGLSLLVPEKNYSQVMEYVDSHDLKGRLVYYRVSKDLVYSVKTPYPNELRTKINFKDNGEATEFVRQHLSEKYSFICTENHDQFIREPKAITPQGQIKSGRRHEKDDRHRLDDRSNYVLGWSNTDKLIDLARKLSDCRETLKSVEQQTGDIKNRYDTLQNAGKLFARLEDYKSYDEIDYFSPTEKLNDLKDELQVIENGSDVFKMLNDKIKRLEEEIDSLESESDGLAQKIGGFENEIDSAQKELNSLKAELDGFENSVIVSELLLKQLYEKELDGKSLTLVLCDKVKQHIHNELDNCYRDNDSKEKKGEQELIKKMSSFKGDYEVETQEMDVSVQSWPQYADMLKKIESDDLPRFEGLFKKKLRDNTLNDVATLNAFLETSSSEISKRISVINIALKSIEYDPGRHIQLKAFGSEDQEIKQFKYDLRQMIDNRSEIDTGTLQVSEERFIKVKELIDRFKGRPGSVEADRRWRQKVTDVRRWYEFAAVELWNADDSEFEFYKDSSGKSGGQKEKLAYTILATSLAYQFGVGIGNKSSDRSFRFVIVDEAFGRGSDVSAKFGLEIFKKLNLQLLVVTPLQKISIIEPYVEHVAVVSKDELSSESAIRNLTIEEYRLLKKKKELISSTR